MFFTKRHLEVVITWADNGGWIVYIGDSRRVYTDTKKMVRDLEDYFGEPTRFQGAQEVGCMGDDDYGCCPPVLTPTNWTTTGGDCDV